MGNIVGTIIALKDFLFKKDTEVETKCNGAKCTVFRFKKDRKLFVPNYQREIRWGKENLFVLMNDISHGDKFLGNIILSSKAEKDFEIIDGQQRIVSLIMLIKYIKNNYSTEITNIDELIFLEVNCFDKYEIFQNNGYSFENLTETQKTELQCSDKLDQAFVLEELYTSIEKSGMLNTSAKARAFWDSLRKCTINVILSDEEDRKISTEYYIDVNLKGVKLDNEDIFKGYLFSQDTSEEIRNYWVELKQSWFEFNKVTTKNKKKTIYPFMKIIEHYIYCCILSKPEYVQVNIDENFNLEKTCEVNSNNYYVGDHVVKVINNNTYMRKTIKETKEYIDFLAEICEAIGISGTVNRLLSKVSSVKKVIINNFIKKMILDKTLIVPKTLVMKYYFDVLANNNRNEQEQMFGIYFYSTFFMLFGNKKNADVIKDIARSSDYYKEVVIAAKDFFLSRNLYDASRIAIARWNSDFDNEDLKYKCKSLATIYNYFQIVDDKINFKDCMQYPIKKFLEDEDEFSIEHFIVNDSVKTAYITGEQREVIYNLPEDVKQYHKYIFNYIFISANLNNNVLKNYALQHKLELLSLEENNVTIKCEYSKMVVSVANENFVGEPIIENLDENKKSELETYWLVTFKKEYNKYVERIIDKIIEKFV